MGPCGNRRHPLSPRHSHAPTVNIRGAIDGDTLDIAVGALRLFGVDTQERGQQCSKEATDGRTGLAGDSIRVENGPRATGPCGRALYYVYTMAGYSIDAVLIREGWQVPGRETASTRAI